MLLCSAPCRPACPYGWLKQLVAVKLCGCAAEIQLIKWKGGASSPGGRGERWRGRRKRKAHEVGITQSGSRGSSPPPPLFSAAARLCTTACPASKAIRSFVVRLRLGLEIGHSVCALLCWRAPVFDAEALVPLVLGEFHFRIALKLILLMPVFVRPAYFLHSARLLMNWPSSFHSASHDKGV